MNVAELLCALRFGISLVDLEAGFRVVLGNRLVLLHGIRVWRKDLTLIEKCGVFRRMRMREG